MRLDQCCALHFYTQKSHFVEREGTTKFALVTRVKVDHSLTGVLISFLYIPLADNARDLLLYTSLCTILAQSQQILQSLYHVHQVKYGTRILDTPTLRRYEVRQPS